MPVTQAQALACHAAFAVSLALGLLRILFAQGIHNKDAAGSMQLASSGGAT